MCMRACEWYLYVTLVFNDKNLKRKETFPNNYFQNALSITQVCFEKQLLSRIVLKHQLYIEDTDCVHACGWINTSKPSTVRYD